MVSALVVRTGRTALATSAPATSQDGRELSSTSGLNARECRTHSLRMNKASMVDESIGNLRARQIRYAIERKMRSVIGWTEI